MNPSGNGSSSISTYLAYAVIQARPPISGTIAFRSPTETSSTTRHRKGFANMPSISNGSSTNTIIVATVLLETGVLPMVEPVTELILEPPAGLIRVRAHCDGGRVRLVEFQNVPSFATRLDAVITVEGHGEVTVDVAFGGMAKVLIDVRQLGLEIAPEHGYALREAALAVAAAASEQIGFRHPLNAELNTIESEVLYQPPSKPRSNIRQTTVNIGGQMDRTPAGTGASAMTAVLYENGRVGLPDMAA